MTWHVFIDTKSKSIKNVRIFRELFPPGGFQVDSLPKTEGARRRPGTGRLFSLQALTSSPVGPGLSVSVVDDESGQSRRGNRCFTETRDELRVGISGWDQSRSTKP